MTDAVVCARGHRLLRFEAEGCRAHGTHRVYVCPMRRGRSVCGEVTVLPPFGPDCDDERDE